MKQEIDKEQYELYENARKRASQIKGVYNHLILILIGCVFLFIANNWLGAFPEIQWFWWAIAIWVFMFLLHFINVFITKKFMGKEWEQRQIDKLVKKQEARITELQKNIDNQNSKS